MPEYYWKIKRYLRHENKVNENRVFYFEALRYICKSLINKQRKKVSIMSNLQTHYHFKLDYQSVHQHTGGNWLIHGTKHHKDNQ